MGGTTALWLDCQAGIAGDMLVAALLDVAPDRERAHAAVMDALDSLQVEGFAVEVSRVAKAGLSCLDFAVHLDAEHENHDHDMAYLHGAEHAGGHSHHGHNEHAHDHEAPGGYAHHDHGAHAHAHDHDGHHACGPHIHHHEHRGLAEIDALIASARMTPAARALAAKAFAILGEAEAKAHGLPVSEVHFHEVGAVDSIVDVVAAAVLLDHLGIERVVVPVLVEGHGTIRCQHGVIPVPVPATCNICQAHGLPLAPCEVEGELVTPTGAALVAALEPEFELPERYLVHRVGLGAGKRTYSRPSVLRAVIIEDVSGRVHKETPAMQPSMQGAHTAELEAPTRVVKLECDIDDATAEQMAFATDALIAAGAREAHWIPLFTKKGRPAYQLQVLCSTDEVSALEQVIFRETTTLGIRRCLMERTVLPRRLETVATPYGQVPVKVATLSDGTERVKPEYEACAACARAAGVSVGSVMDAARFAYAGAECAARKEDA